MTYHNHNGVQDASLTWWNDYVGIPYAEYGRTRAGLDCWGLIRLIYADVFKIALPSFLTPEEGTYQTESDESIDELIALKKANWSLIADRQAYQPGDVISFHVGGYLAHVGVYVGEGKFIHARRGQDVVIEPLFGLLWGTRIEGVYRYTPTDNTPDNELHDRVFKAAQLAAFADAETVLINSILHPLKWDRVPMYVKKGQNLEEMLQQLLVDSGIPSFESDCTGIFKINGKQIDQEAWATTFPGTTDTIEYRVVPKGGKTFRSIANVALQVGALILAPYVSPIILGLGLYAANTLLNAIFPVRPTEEFSIDQGKTANILLGGQNQASLFSPIPVVLGKHRMTAPLGAQNYIEAVGAISYIRMLLIWGYGPLEISEIRLGMDNINNYDEVMLKTLTGLPTDNLSTITDVYGNDKFQLVPNQELLRTASQTDGAETIVSGTTTISMLTSNPAYERPDWQIGWFMTFYQASIGWAQAEIVGKASNTTFTVAGNFFVDPSNTWASPKYEYTLPSKCSAISLLFHWPQGLRRIHPNGGQSTLPARITIEYREIDDVTLAPITGWNRFAASFPETNYQLPTAFYNINTDLTLEAVVVCHEIRMDVMGNLVLRTGSPSTGYTIDASGQLLANLIANAPPGAPVSFPRVPPPRAGEWTLWQIQVVGTVVGQYLDKRAELPFAFTGGNLIAIDNTQRIFKIEAGSKTIDSMTVATNKYGDLNFGSAGEAHAYEADAFSETAYINVPYGRYQVRVQNLTFTNNADIFGVGWTILDRVILLAITGFADTKPVKPPVPIAMSALRILATNQISGNVDGISATAISIAKDYDSATGTWIERPTRNPASLYRHVLQHPGNIAKVPDNLIDLPTLESWHVYCRSNGFGYDNVIVEKVSVEDLLRDIAAAGRASPDVVEGLHTVVIDRPRTVIAQHFTPHNSWGFRGARQYTKVPHAFRIEFMNAAKGFQPDEIIVYNDGYGAVAGAGIQAATDFEALSFPGITSAATIFKHARFHMAQLRLRPEQYFLNTDWEQIICKRGDLVRVVHDVPRFGLGSARIKSRPTTTSLVLDTPVPMTAGIQYTIRIRLADNTSITRIVAAKGIDGYYTDITVTSTLTTIQAATGNLVLFGTLNAESVELVVLEKEMLENGGAQLTLQDYAPAVYTSDSGAIPAFNSNITLPPVLMQKLITVSPTIVSMQSDESTMLKLTSKTYSYGISLTFKHVIPRPVNAQFVVGEIRRAGSSGWSGRISVPVSKTQIIFRDVLEGETYQMRIWYESVNGVPGPKVLSANHIVTGRKAKPSGVTNPITTIDPLGLVVLSWDPVDIVDFSHYEVRTVNSGWGTAGFIYKGPDAFCNVIPAVAGTARIWYIRTYDTAGNSSATVASPTLTITRPGTPPVPTQTPMKVLNGSLNLGLAWEDAVQGSFVIAGYEIRAANSGWGTAGFRYKGNVSECILNTIPNNATSTFYLRAFDALKNYSAAAVTITHDVVNPATMASTTATLTRVGNDLRCTLTGFPAKPVDFDCYEFRFGQVRAGATSGDDTPDAVVSGTTDNFWSDPDCAIVQSTTPLADIAIATFPIPRLSSTGVTYRVACRMRDKSGNYSPASCVASYLYRSIT